MNSTAETEDVILYSVQSALTLTVENVAPTLLTSDAKFINNIAISIGIVFDIELSKVSIIDLEVVSHDSDLGQATQRGRNRMLSEAEQILEVEYRLITTEAKRIQDILDDLHESTRVSASFKEVLSEKELASGRPL